MRRRAPIGRPFGRAQGKLAFPGRPEGIKSVELESTSPPFAPSWRTNGRDTFKFNLHANQIRMMASVPDIHSQDWENSRVHHRVGQINGERGGYTTRRLAVLLLPEFVNRRPLPVPETPLLCVSVSGELTQSYRKLEKSFSWQAINSHRYRAQHWSPALVLVFRYLTQDMPNLLAHI